MEISAYRLTIIGAVVILILSVAVVTIESGPQNAAMYLGLVGTIAIPGLLALFKLESNAKVQSERHVENVVQIADANAKIDALRASLAADNVKEETPQV